MLIFVVLNLLDVIYRNINITYKYTYIIWRIHSRQPTGPPAEEHSEAVDWGGSSMTSREPKGVAAGMGAVPG